jgi:nicotinamide riboside kinase
VTQRTTHEPGSVTTWVADGVASVACQKDDYSLHWGHRLLNHALTEAEGPHVHTENPGNHGGRWPERYQIALSGCRTSWSRPI